MSALDTFERWWGAGPFASRNMRDVCANFSVEERATIRSMGWRLGWRVGILEAWPNAAISGYLGRTYGTQAGVISFCVGMVIIILFGLHDRKKVKIYLATTRYAQEKGLEAKDL